MSHPFTETIDESITSPLFNNLIDLCIKALPKDNSTDQVKRFRLALKINGKTNPSYTKNLASLIITLKGYEWTFIYRDVQCLINCANLLGANLPPALLVPVTELNFNVVAKNPCVAYFMDKEEFRIVP
jgi:hypothetical protein